MSELKLYVETEKLKGGPVVLDKNLFTAKQMLEKKRFEKLKAKT